MKDATKHIRGIVINLVRLADLLDMAHRHDDDPIGQSQSLGLVVGDINHGRPEPMVQKLDLTAHRRAEFGIEVRERLVEKEDFRIADDRAAHRDPLALAA
jgi:hypothetical protein